MKTEINNKINEQGDIIEDKISFLKTIYNNIEEYNKKNYSYIKE